MMGEDINEEIPVFILGDSTYRNSRHMVTTYKVTECNADRSVRHLNFELSKARYQVEHAFGLLKGRFQVFEKPLRSAGEDLPFSVRLITSICVIHNFLIDARDTVPEADIFKLQQSEMAGWRKMMLMMKKSGVPGSRIMKELHGKHLYVIVDG